MQCGPRALHTLTDTHRLLLPRFGRQLPAVLERGPKHLPLKGLGGAGEIGSSLIAVELGERVGTKRIWLPIRGHDGGKDHMLPIITS